MKRFSYLLMTFFLSMFTVVAHADPAKVIILRQNPIPGSRSIIPEVTANITNDNVTINVNRYTGNATVEITDVNGTTWQTDTAYVYGHAQMNMNVSSIACGNYTLTITLANGITYEGEFEITD